MTIISISIEDELLEQLDETIENQGFSGRSDAIRQAIRTLIANLKDVNNIDGEVEGVLTIIHKENTKEFNKVLHDHLDIIQTQLHNHLENHNCLELLVVKGEAKRIKSFKKATETCKCVNFVNLLIN